MWNSCAAGKNTIFIKLLKKSFSVSVLTQLSLSALLVILPDAGVITVEVS
jgi:hypothetical protein